MQNEKPGLKIIYSKSIERGNRALTAKILAGTGTYGHNFITTPDIRNALKKNNYQPGAEIGTIEVVYIAREKAVIWRRFFPIPHVKGDPVRSFRRKGIASLIEAHVNREIQKTFPRARLAYQLNPSVRREEQLKNRGFSIWEISKGIPSKDFSKAMRDKLAHDIKKARAKRRV